MNNNLVGIVFQIQHFSVNDGEGIRSTIFMSGCPLRCKWCCNPESWETKPGLYGKKMSIEEILNEIKRYMIFYRYSGGGVTYSGGEPTFQSQFLRGMVNSFYNMGIHQSIETCGYFYWDNVKNIFEKLDFIFVDIKHINSKVHKDLTGYDNELILDNIINLGKLHKEIVVRIPLIKGINDSKDNIIKTAEFVHSNVPFGKIEILSYHSQGNYKYNSLGLEKYQNYYIPPDKEDIDNAKNIIKSFGIEIIDFK